MTIQKPSIPKGTRDFSPIEMMRRGYIFNTIKNIFEKHKDYDMMGVKKRNAAKERGILE